jgi:KDO2-lipid IV(A) lauroyltransferase
MKLISRKKTRKFRHDLLYFAAKMGYSLAQKIPRHFGLFFFGAIGKLIFLFPGLDKKRTIEHLRFIYGNRWSEQKIHQVASKVYVNIGKNLFDSIHLSQMDTMALDTIVTCDPVDELKREYGKVKGIITVTSHSGCFEMLLHYFPAHGFKCFAIGRKMFDQRLENLVRQTRAGKDTEYLDRSEGTRKMIRLLNEGRFFGVLIDQDTNVEGVWADFLGHTAFTPSGPVKLAMKFNIPLFVITTARLEKERHHIFISPKVDMVQTDNFEADLQANVTKVNSLICETINRFPSQWVWMHRRWLHQPSDGQK